MMIAQIIAEESPATQWMLNGCREGPPVYACEDCLHKVVNRRKAQKFFRLMFRTHRVVSSSTVADNLGAFLAQYWTVGDLRKQRVWNIWRNFPDLQ